MKYITAKPWELSIIEEDGSIIFRTDQSEIEIAGCRKEHINSSFFQRLWHNICLASGLEIEVVLNNVPYLMKTRPLKKILSSKDLENNPIVLALKGWLGTSLISLVPSLYLEEQLTDFKKHFQESLKKELKPFEFVQEFIDRCRTLGEAIEKIQPRSRGHLDKIDAKIQEFDQRFDQQQELRALLGMQRLVGIPSEDVAQRELQELKNEKISLQREFFQFLNSHVLLSNEYRSLIQELESGKTSQERVKEIVKILFEELDNAILLGGIKKRDEEIGITIIKRLLEERKDELIAKQKQAGVQNEFLFNCLQLAVADIVDILQSVRRIDFVNATNAMIDVDKFNTFLESVFNNIIRDKEERLVIVTSLLQPLQKRYHEILSLLEKEDEQGTDSEYVYFVINTFYGVLDELQIEVSYLKGDLHTECNKLLQAVQDSFDQSVERLKVKKSKMKV